MRATDDGELFEQFIASHWGRDDDWEDAQVERDIDRQLEEMREEKRMASFYRVERVEYSREGEGYSLYARHHGETTEQFVTAGSLDYLDGYLSGLAESDTGDDKGDLACDPDNRMELHAVLARARREA